MNALRLFLKNLLFTVMVPGFAAGWVPFRWWPRPLLPTVAPFDTGPR